MEIDAKKILNKHKKLYNPRKLDVVCEGIIKDLAQELNITEVEARLCIIAYLDFIRKGISETDIEEFENLKTYRIPQLGSFQPSKRKHKYYLRKYGNTKFTGG